MFIEMFADVICPWCYIGRHRLLHALTERPRIKAELRWQTFQLNPDMPAGGMDRILYMAAKFGSLDRARQVYAVVEESAAREGLPIFLNRVRRIPNTFDAHRLIRLADRVGRADPMVDALFHAYFSEGLDIGDREVLIAMAAAAGLDADEVRCQLASDAEVEGVRASDDAARRIGLQAVPCYVFDKRYALAGAQEPAAFLPLLDLAADETPVWA